jgi:PHD/YefM family antitoxin component YafN of YafNO toxin-antitoxin module
MQTVSATDFESDFRHYRGEALKAPLTVVGDGQDALIVMSVDEYRRLKRHERAVFPTETLSEAELLALTEGGMDPRHDHLNAELDRDAV